MQKRNIRRTISGTALVLIVALAAGCLAARDEAGRTTAATGTMSKSVRPGVLYQYLERDTPRPTRIHVLRIDLKQAERSLAVTAAPDPDGDGPAETVLSTPHALARQGNTSSTAPPTKRGRAPSP